MKLSDLHLLGGILAGALGFMIVVGVPSFMPTAAAQSNSQESLGKTKSLAETQHEIVMLLLKKKEYEKAAVEANRIFEMPWPESQEPLLLKELLILSDQFLRHGQAMLGLQIIEKNSKCFKKATSQAEILKEQGYLYKSLNQNDRALECFQKARELENKN
jgi:tetratricopeptide (TPR) repeat protein